MAINFSWTAVRDEVINMLRPELEIAFNEADLDPRVEGWVLEALGFSTFQTRLPQGLITRMWAVLALPKLNENGTKQRGSYGTWDEKGYKVAQYGEEYAISKLALKTLRDNWLDMWLFHPTVQAELSELSSNVKRLGIATKLAQVDEATKLFVNWFSISSDYGAGSPAPDWLALFSNSHASGDNLVTWVINDTTAQTKLLEGINLLRNIKNDKGAIYKLPKMFTLVCSPSAEYTWRKALNNNWQWASTQDDVAIGNDITMNVFVSVDWFKVALLVLESIWQPDRDWVKIGTGTEAFLLDRDRLSMAKALRLIKLYDVEVSDYTRPETGEYVVGADIAFTVDHFGAEIGIVWFTWA